MNHRDIHIEDGEAIAFGRGSTSPSAQASAAGSSVIQFQFQAVSAALVGLDATEPDDCFESLGSVAVRLVGQWKLPRILVLARE